MPHNTSSTLLLQVSAFTRKEDNAPQLLDLNYPTDFSEFAVAAPGPKPETTVDGEHIPLWSPATFAPNTVRAAGNVLAVCALVLDIDGAEDTQRAFDVWSDYDFVLHTTRSHTEASPSYRLVIPYSSPATPAQHRATWAWAEQRMGHGNMDEQCKDVGRMYYVPTCTDVPSEYAHNPGKALEPLDAEAGEQEAYSAPRPSPVAGLEAFSHVRTTPGGQRVLDAALDVLVEATLAGTGRHAAIRAQSQILGGHIAGGSVSVEDAVALLTDFATRWGGVDQAPTAMSGLLLGAARPIDTGESIEAAFRRSTASSNAAAPGAPEPVLFLADTTANGDPKPSLSNTIHILEADPSWTGSLYWDVRSLEVRWDETRMVEMRDMIGAAHGRSCVSDHDIRAMRHWINQQPDYHFTPSKEDMFEAVVHVARKHQRNELTEWLEQCAAEHEQDGKARIDTWLIDYAGVEDSPLHRMYGRRTLIAAVARAYVDLSGPGTKVDTVLTLQGKQGARKSMLLRRMAGKGGFSDSHIDVANKDSYMVIRQPWIFELGELDKMSRQEAGKVKAFMSSQTDTFRAPYGRVAETFPRQGIFVSTVNPKEFLTDATGSRRFWAVEVSDSITLPSEAIVRLMWGEAVWAFREGEALVAAGQFERSPETRWWMDSEEEEVREDEALTHVSESAYSTPVLNWLRTPRATNTFVLSDLLTGIGLSLREQPQAIGPVSQVLKDLGCVSERHMVRGVRTRSWTVPEHLYTPPKATKPAVNPYASNN